MPSKPAALQEPVGARLADALVGLASQRLVDDADADRATVAVTFNLTEAGVGGRGGAADRRGAPVVL